jgi:hypothetical protein
MSHTKFLSLDTSAGGVIRKLLHLRIITCQCKIQHFMIGYQFPHPHYLSADFAARVVVDTLISTAYNCEKAGQ